MKRKKYIFLLCAACSLTTSTFASSIFYKEPYIISNRFSIKPSFNTGEGNIIKSPRFSIKPAFNSGLTKYFYSGVVSIMDMPDVTFLVDGKPLAPGVKVKDSSEIKLMIDFSNCSLKNELQDVSYFVESITDGEISEKQSVPISEHIVDSVLTITLESDKTYRIGQVSQFSEGLKYEVVSKEFTVNEKGLIDFLSPIGSKLYEEFVVAQFRIDKVMEIQTFDLFIEKADGTRLLVGDDLTFETTKIEETDKETIHEFKYKLPEGIKTFKHVISKVN